MTVLDLKTKLDEMIAKGGAEYKVYTCYKSETENSDGDLIDYISEVEASDIEIEKYQTYYFKYDITWPARPNEKIFNPVEYHLKLTP